MVVTLSQHGPVDAEHVEVWWGEHHNKQKWFSAIEVARHQSICVRKIYFLACATHCLQQSQFTPSYIVVNHCARTEMPSTIHTSTGSSDLGDPNKWQEVAQTQYDGSQSGLNNVIWYCRLVYKLCTMYNVHTSDSINTTFYWFSTHTSFQCDRGQGRPDIAPNGRSRTYVLTAHKHYRIVANTWHLLSYKGDSNTINLIMATLPNPARLLQLGHSIAGTLA